RYLSCFCFQSIFDLEKLTYCGEGNRTIVVSNTASGWILRIRKSDETATSSHDGSSSNCLSTLAQFPVAPYILRYFGSRFTRKMQSRSYETESSRVVAHASEQHPHSPGALLVRTAQLIAWCSLGLGEREICLHAQFSVAHPLSSLHLIYPNPFPSFV
ncbi:hypothetical protein AHF37_10514, partial [Paragonimus kellicotti]